MAQTEPKPIAETTSEPPKDDAAKANVDEKSVSIKRCKLH